ncbi:MAG: tail fiber domain-containing protein [bacterium]|nr:tail fiber domain-containing protein [bacterium]
MLSSQTTSRAATINQFTFQARILSKDRTSTPTGNYNFRFSIFNVETGGSQLWQETTNGVTVNYGKFTVILGNSTSLNSVNFNSEALYLLVEFDSDNNGSFDQSFDNRLALTAVPVAQNAKKLGGKSGSQFATLTENETVSGSYLFENNLTVQGTTVLAASLNGMVKASSGTIQNAIAGADYQAPISWGDGLTVDNNTAALDYNSTNLRITSEKINTIQDIATGATPQFARIGVGQAANNSLISLPASTGATGGFDLGGDVNLYRSASNTLKTDDSLVIGGTSADLLAQGDLRLYDTDSSNYVALQSPTSVSSNIVWTLPGTDSSGCLSSNGSGTISIAACLSAAAPTDAQYLTLAANGTLSAERILLGTSNQIILADTGANGNLTLSLPQDIATSSAVQFGSLGLGTAAGSAKLTFTAATTAAGGIDFGTDVTLYRSAANRLKTDDVLIVDTGASVTDITSFDAGTVMVVASTGHSTISTYSTRNTDGSAIGGMRFYGNNDAASPSVIQYGIVSGSIVDSAAGDETGKVSIYTRNDTASSNDWGRVDFDENGKIWLGAVSASGTGTNDVNLYRSTTDTLKTDDAFIAANITSGGLTSGRVTYAGASGLLQDSASMTFDTTNGLILAAGSASALKLSSTAGTAVGGLLLGTDTTLYRSTTDTLKTDDSLIVAGASLDLLTQGDVRLYDSDSSNYVAFQSPATVGTNIIWTLPSTDSSGCLSSNGSATLSWAACSGSGSLDDAYNNGSTITVDAGAIVLNDSGTTTTLFDINQSGAITGTAPLIDVDYSTSINNAADYASLSLTGVTNAGAGFSIGIDLAGFDYGIQSALPYVLSSSKAADSIDFLSKKPDSSGGTQFLFDTSATVATASLFAVKNNGTGSIFVINGNGRVGIGTEVAGDKLDVQGGNIRNSALAGVGNRAVYSDANGVLTNSASDQNIKTNIVSLASSMSALDTISQLRGVYYNWLDTDRLGSQREIGFVAQEVQPYLPELIGSNHDGTLSLDYPKLTAVLTEAVKQLNTEVKALQGTTMTAEEIISPTSKDLILRPSTGKILAQGSIDVAGTLVVSGATTLADTLTKDLAVAGTFMVKGSGTADYELDGSEDDTNLIGGTEKAAIANGQTETNISIPSQGTNNYSVIATWLNDPGQSFWTTVTDSEHFKVRVSNPVAADSTFRYLLINNEQ